MKSYCDVDGVELKSKIQKTFRVKLLSLAQVSGETIFDNDLEDQLDEVVKASSDPLTGIVAEVLDFLFALLQYRVCKGKL